MDDYIWKKRLQERQRRVKQERFFVVLLLAAVAGCTLWYFGIYTHTPEYAVRQTVQALENRDGETFRKYVDVDTILSHAYDDLTVDLFSDDASLSKQTKALFEKFYVLIKPQVTERTARLIDRHIETGAWDMPEGADILKGRQLGIDYDQFLERSLLQTTTCTDVGNVLRTDEGAVAQITVTDDSAPMPFTLRLALEETPEGHWRITHIQNYRAYLDTVALPVHRDIAAYVSATAKIVDGYNASLHAQQERFRSMGGSSGGRLDKRQRDAIAAFLEQETIPLLRERQQLLDEVSIPPGARHLAELRSASTDASIKGWQHYILGLQENSHVEYEAAESLHKQALALEQRIEEVIARAAVNENIPHIP